MRGGVLIYPTWSPRVPRVGCWADWARLLSIKYEHKILENGEKQMSLGRILVIGVISGIVVGIACFFAFKLVGADASPAVVSGVTGGVAGAIVPTLLRRKSK